jgi:hypothetical protein
MSSRSRNVKRANPVRAEKDEAPVQVHVRMPVSLQRKLEKAAEQSGSNVTEEIRQRLAESFTEAMPADPRFDDLLAAAAYAAGAAGRMFPPRPVTVSETLARQMGAESREVADITASWLFETCLSMLIAAFRPIGIPGSLPEDHDAFQAELLRRADRIVGAALDRLGGRGREAFNRLAPIDQETIAASGPIGARLAAEAPRDEVEDDR